MFAKKFLSFIGGLFIGSQFISSVTAEAVPGLKDCSSTSLRTNSYCISSEGIIYHATITNNIPEKEPIIEPGIYGFSSELNDLSTLEFSGGNFIGSFDDDKKSTFSVYDCIDDVYDRVICKRTYGYIFYNNMDYIIAGKNGNYKFGDIPFNNDCSGDKAGIIYYNQQTPKLCIDGKHDALVLTDSANKNYFVKNTKGNIFNNADENEEANEKYIVVKASKNAFTLVDYDYDYCDMGDEVAEETFMRVCESEGDDNNPCGVGAKIYETINGLIERDVDYSCKIKIEVNDNVSIVTDVLNCGEGYYVFNGDTGKDEYHYLQEVDTPGVLYHCQQDIQSEGKVNCVEISGDEYRRGYYVNAAATSPTTDAYIACAGTYDTCKVIAISNDCTSSGNIVLKQNDVYGLCLEDGLEIVPVDIDKEKEVKQFVSLDNENVFGSKRTGKYILVTSKSGNVLVDAKGSNRKYIYTDDKYVPQYQYDEQLQQEVIYRENVCHGKSIIEFIKVFKKEDGETPEDNNIYDKEK